MDEAVRRGLPAGTSRPSRDAGIAAVGDPKLDLSDLPERGLPLSFTIEVGVVPPAKLGDYKGLEVGRREPSVSSDEVQAELERLRESLASLETVERAAGQGDFAVIDFAGSVDGEPFEGGEARGHLVELGSGRLIPGFEEQLEGIAAGDEREVKVTFPDDYPAEHLAGKDASFAVEVKEVKEKRLPELDDDFAVEAGGYDSLDELRAELEQRIGEAQEREIEGEFREAAVDAAVAAAEVEVPHELVHAKAHEMWHRTSRRLAAAGRRPAPVPADGRQGRGGARHRGGAGRGAGAQARGGADAIVGPRASRSPTRRSPRPCARRPGRDASDKQLKRAMKRAAGAGRRRGAARGHRHAQGRGPAGGERQADPGRAGGRAREALDTRQGEGGERRADLDARLSSLDWRAL